MQIPRPFYSEGWSALHSAVLRCARCPRLRAYARHRAESPPSSLRGLPHWGRPVPGFGDPKAWLWILGLAPGARGAYRTGRMFTGDASGDFLFASLYRAGLCNQPTSRHREDGLQLYGVYISAIVRCLPPQNRPTSEEIANCFPYLERELRLLSDLRVLVALGRLAHQTARRLLGLHPREAPFRHGAVARSGSLHLIASYHPSPQNTQTGRLTPTMLDAIWEKACSFR